jgi:hypothetical protein
MENIKKSKNIQLPSDFERITTIASEEIRFKR